MDGRQVGRRRALSGGLAAIAAGSAAAASGTGVTWLGRHAPGQHEGEVADHEVGAHQDGAENAAGHAPFRAAFLGWMHEASERFALPPSVDTTALSRTELHLQGVHPAIWTSLTSDGGIDVGVEWDGVFWDLPTSPDVVAEPVAGGGWENALLVPEARVVHPTREATWRAGFEDLLDWVNGELASATHLALWRSESGGCTWAWLARDGWIVRRRRRLADDGAPEHLLPVHETAGMTVRAEPVGQVGDNNRDRRTAVAIGSAVQRGSHVYVYDERGRQLAMLLAGNGPSDGLQGYTGATVSVRRGGHVFTYDRRGRQLSMTPAR